MQEDNYNNSCEGVTGATAGENFRGEDNYCQDNERSEVSANASERHIHKWIESIMNDRSLYALKIAKSNEEIARLTKENELLLNDKNEEYSLRDNAMAARIKMLHKEIRDLKAKNEELRENNKKLEWANGMLFMDMGKMNVASNPAIDTDYVINKLVEQMERAIERIKGFDDTISNILKDVSALKANETAKGIDGWASK